MKRLLSLSLFIGILCLYASNALAQGYDRTNLSDKYQYSTVFYVDLVNASGTSISNQYTADTYAYYAIGAFVDDELRGAGKATWASHDNVGKYVFTVEVWTDNAAAVEFRLRDKNGEEYVLETRKISAANNTEGTPSSPVTMKFVPITGISITPDPISVVVDETTPFNINFLPEGHTKLKYEMGFKFAAMSEGAAVPFDIDYEKQAVVGLLEGTGTLRAFAGDWNASATVNVSKKVVPVTGLVNGESGLDIEKWTGDEFSLKFNVLPAEATNKNVIYTIGNTNIVGQVSPGVFKALAKGSTTLQVKTEDGGWALNYSITVKQHVTGINVLNPNDAIQVPVGTNVTDYLIQNAATIYQVLPTNAENKAVSYTAIRADGIMTTANGVITATGVGNCLVQIASKDVPNITTTVAFSVYAVPTAITVDTPRKYYYVDEDGHLSYSIQPNGSPQEISVVSSNSNIVKVGAAGNGTFSFTPKQKGTATLTISSKDYPTVKTTIIINVHVRVTSIAFKNQSMTIDRDTKVALTADLFTITPANGDLDISLLSFYTEENITDGLRGLVVDREKDGSAYMTGLTPYPSYTLSVASKDIQDSETACTVNVRDKLTIETGWNWIGNGYDVDNATGFYQAIGNSFVEGRSQSALIYNDTQYGYFGDLGQLTAGEGYKMKANATAVVKATVPTIANGWLNQKIVRTIRVGWNWLANPYPRATTVSQLITAPTNGDVVKTLDGMATYNNGTWSEDLSILEHEGFMYKATKAGTLNWYPGSISDSNAGTRVDGYGPAYGSREADDAGHIWEYDAHLSPGNMGLIATCDGFDDANRYAIGAFVGDECRGKGMLRDGMWYIVAHLTGSEQVSLRLYDRQTRTVHDMTIDGWESLGFSELAGTPVQPLSLDVPAITAIKSLKTAGADLEDAVVTDLSGKTLQRGHVSLEQLPKGIFILTVKTANGQVSRKFMK